MRTRRLDSSAVAIDAFTIPRALSAGNAFARVPATEQKTGRAEAAILGGTLPSPFAFPPTPPSFAPQLSLWYESKSHAPAVVHNSARSSGSTRQAERTKAIARGSE